MTVEMAVSVAVARWHLLLPKAVLERERGEVGVIDSENRTKKLPYRYLKPAWNRPIPGFIQNSASFVKST